MSAYLEDDDVFNMDSILEEIKLELIAVQEMLNTAENDPTQEVTQEPAKKKTRFLAMAAQGGASGDGDDLSQRTKEVYDAENEMVRYSREPILKLDDDVLLWWRENKRMYPCMAYLAKKYLAVQATSTSAERVMSLLGNIVTKKRTMLTDENVKILTYLSDSNY